MDKLISEQYYKKGKTIGIHKEYYQDGRETRTNVLKKRLA